MKGLLLLINLKEEEEFSFCFGFFLLFEAVERERGSSMGGREGKGHVERCMQIGEIGAN